MALTNFADMIGKSYDRLKKPEAFVLAENTAKSTFSDQFAQRAWRRLFWADNFRARVINSAPMADIDASWKSYIDADADWNANIMISIVGLEHYYGAKRSQHLEGRIQALFQQLDEHLAALRRSNPMMTLRNGPQPDDTRTADAAISARLAKDVSDELKTELYVLVRCFAATDKGKNLCN